MSNDTVNCSVLISILLDTTESMNSLMETVKANAIQRNVHSTKKINKLRNREKIKSIRLKGKRIVNNWKRFWNSYYPKWLNLKVLHLLKVWV